MSKGNDKKPKSKTKSNAESAYKSAQSVDKRAPSPFVGKKPNLGTGRKGN